MTPKNWLIAAAGALALGFSAVSAQAAPVSGAASDIRNASGETGAVEGIDSRDYRYGYRRHHHYYGYGHRHYRHYYYGRGHRYDYDRRHHHRRYW